MLRANNVTKSFGPTLALGEVSLEVAAGEIHAVVGENGAGKSTLVNILAGRLAPDHGEILLDGKALSDRGPQAHREIAAVFQSPLLFERFTLIENLALSGFVPDGIRLDLDQVAARARDLARDLHFDLPPLQTRVADCSIGQRVRLEILRALSFNPRVLILDEPTSVLAPAELESFLALLEQLSRSGRGVILVTHKLAEAIAVAHRITVLRRGRKIAERAASGADPAELARMIIGDAPAPLEPNSVPVPTGPVALLLDEIVYEDHGRRVLNRISPEVRRGEIVGVAGVEGNGQIELAALLAGLLTPASGRIHLAPGASLATLPQNRDLDGLILSMPIWENLLLSDQLRCRFSRPGSLDRRRARAFSDQLLTAAAIRAASTDSAAALSGGNRQRLMLARAFAAAPDVLVAHDPCRGMDLRARAAAHQQLRDYVDRGRAVLLISGDLDELFALCHRIYVISRGHLSTLAPEDRDPARLGLLMAGAA